MASKKIKDKEICIVGAGLVGTLLSIFLAKAGYRVDVYEKRPDTRLFPNTKGRSIGLSLSLRGWNALKQVGLDEKIRPNTTQTFGRMVHRKNGEMHYQQYGDGTQAIWAINRDYLNTTLIDEAGKTGKVRIFFDHTFCSIDEKTGEITFRNTATGEGVIKTYDHVFAVDGAFSALRRKLQEKNIWNFKEEAFDFGFKELSITVNSKNEKLLPADALHVWPGANFVLVAMPTFDGNFLSTFFLPANGKDSFGSLNSPEKIKDFFQRECPDVLPFMPDLAKDFENNPASNLTQVSGGPWNYKDKVLLMGDAAHATTPFYGMGMNTGFEDCLVFMNLLESNNFNFSKTFKKYTEVRKLDADTMTQLSYGNFKNLKDSPDCNYEKKWILERKIWKLLPKIWTPVYILMTSTQVPFKEIPNIKKRQEAILEKLVTENPNILGVLDEELVALTLSAIKSSHSKYYYMNIIQAAAYLKQKISLIKRAFNLYHLA